MAANEQFLKQMRDTFDHVLEGSKAVDQSWRDIARQVEQINFNNSRGWGAAFLKLGGIQERVLHIGNTLRETLDNPDFAKGFAAAQMEKLKLLQDAMVQLHTSGEIDRKGGREKLAILEKETAQRVQHMHLITEVDKLIKGQSLIWVPALIAELRISTQWFDQMRAGLKQANASWADQLGLLYSVGRVQASTGASMETMRETSSALVKYGFDLKGSFKDNLEIVTKMKDGLEVSADSAAEMLAIMNRLHTSGAGVADAIARIKADTGLSAEQATRFAIEIGRAMSVLGSGAGTHASEIVDYIGRLEGASQSLGLTVGGVKDMLLGFTKEQGMMGISTLGFQPDFIKDLGKTKAVTEGFVSYVEKQLTGTTGFQRMATLQLLAQQFGTTTDVIGNAGVVMAEYNKQQKTNTSLNREWAEVTKTFSGAWERMKNSVMALLQTALLPVLAPLAKLIGYGADFLGWVAGSKAAIAGLSAALVYFTVKAAAALLSTRLLGDNLLGSSVKGVAGKLLGGGTGVAGLLRAFLPRIVMSLTGLTVGTLGLGVLLGSAIGAPLGYLARKLIPGLDTTVQKMYTSMTKSSAQLAHETKMDRMGKYSLTDFDRDVTTALNKKGWTPKSIEDLVRTKGMQVIPGLLGADDKKKRDEYVKALLGRVAGMEHEERKAEARTTTTSYDRESLEHQAKISPAINRLTDSVELQTEMMRRADEEVSGRAATRRADEEHREWLRDLHRLVNKTGDPYSWQPGAGAR